jgi:methyl-accepting chemotaxis protein
MKKKGFKSIRLEMVFYISAIAILICAAFFFTSMKFSDSAVSGLLEDSLTQVTTQGATIISNEVDAVLARLKIIAANDLFKSSELSQFRMFTLFNNMQEISGDEMDLAFAGADGIAYQSGDRQVFVGGTENFTRGMAGESYVSDPVPTGTDDGMTMTFSVPVYDRDDQIRGVLLCFYDGYKLSDMIAGISLTEDDYAFAINGDGVIVAHPDRALVLEQKPMLLEATDNSEMAGLADMLNLMIEGKSGVAEYTYNSVFKSAGYAPIQGTNWFIALTAPYDSVYARVNQLRTILILASVALALLSAGLALVIANRIYKPIRKIEGELRKFSAGDLDVDVAVNRRDEIGSLAQSLDVVADNLTKIISGIRTGAGEVATESREISNSGQQFAQGSTEQASALEEITASMEQIAAQTRTNAGNADEANRLVASTRNTAERGNGKMGSLLLAMQDIDQSSSDIVSITKVIDDIAFQTNILALNAAVEAAHAGEQGKGFAVVAQEVRNLAAKSAEAAKETADLIQISSDKVAGGVQLAQETADALAAIVREITSVAALVSGISVASGEQSLGIEQINQGLEQVSQVVQANSASSQQSASVARHLNEQADSLERQVAGFHLRGTAAPQKTRASKAAPKAPSDPGKPKKKGPKQRKEFKAPKEQKERKERDWRGMRDKLGARVRGAAKLFKFGRGKGKPAAEAMYEDDAPPVKPPMPADISLDDEPAPGAADKKSSKVALSDREFGKY